MASRCAEKLLHFFIIDADQCRCIRFVPLSNLTFREVPLSCASIPKASPHSNEVEKVGPPKVKMGVLQNLKLWENNVTFINENGVNVTKYVPYVMPLVP